MKEKILVVFTGGTIGSVINNNIIDVLNDEDYLLLKMYKGLEDIKDVIFDTIAPVNMLSENADLESWNTIANSILKKDLSLYKGIIITHGTDTLGYFANGMYYMLNMIKIPIVVVSSNLVLTNKNANGLSNFKAAVDFILQCKERGVFVSYKNSDGIIYIHEGKKVKQIAELTEDLYSINNHYYAKIQNNRIIKNSGCKKTEYYDIKFNPKYDGILYIKPLVGQKYDFDLDKFKIIYHEMFHSGTIPKQAMPLIKECQKKGKLFFMGTTQGDKQDLYAPTQEAIDNGAIIITDISQEFAIVKLMMANGTFDSNDQIKKFMKNVM